VSWKPNPLTKQDAEAIRAELNALGPEFEAAGRGDWFDNMMTRFEQVAKHAAGTENIYVRRGPDAAGATPASGPTTRSGLAVAVDSGVRSEHPLSGGAVAKSVDLVTFKNGDRAVRKRSQDVRHPKTGELRVDAKHQADAEELASLVAKSMGISAPQVHRSSDDEVYMEYMTGRPAMDLYVDGEDEYDRAVANVLKRDDAVLLAAFEAITDNTDRNDGNWLINPDGSVTSIDHGFAWSFLGSGSNEPPLGTGPFVRLVASGGRNSLKWRDNDLSKKDVATIRARLEGMRSDFTRLGRSDWLDASLERLAELEPYAKGAKVRLA
jgi:hypothetical protein